MTPQQHDRLLMLLRNDNWSTADQIHIMNLVRQEFPATLRDEFAASALALPIVQRNSSPSKAAYQVADAMLEARKS